MRRRTKPTSRRTLRTVGGATVTALLVLLTVVPTLAAPSATTAAPPLEHSGASARAALAAVSPGNATMPLWTTPLSLGITTSSSSLCAEAAPTCVAAPATLRVNLTVLAPSLAPGNESPVQVLFLLDGSVYGGGCALATGPSPSAMCTYGAANAVEDFLTNAGPIAASIQGAHPGTNLSFGLALTIASGGNRDDGDDAAYAAVVGNFVNASLFGPAVTHIPYSLGDMDSADNLLQSGVTAALYGAFTGQSLAYFSYLGFTTESGGTTNWTSNAHHVVVWIGSRAPQAENYSEDYCPLTWNNATFACPGGDGPNYGLRCEPNWTFSGGPIPACEGWASSQDGVPADSVAALAVGSPLCHVSVGNRCTVDAVMVNATSTDPDGPGWLPGKVSGDKLSDVRNDTDHVLQAGCDIALATGGSWDGPLGSTCHGRSGDLPFVPWSNASGTGTSSLDRALQNISLGGATSGTVVATAAPSAPLLRFAPSPGFAFASPLNATATCSTPDGVFPSCDVTPVVSLVNGSSVLSWNWSTNSSDNTLLVGDVWNLSFDLVSDGAAANASPIDLCAVPGCVVPTTVPVGSLFTGIEFDAWGLADPVAEPFPAANVTVVAPPGLTASLGSVPRPEGPPSYVLFTATAAGGYPPYVVDWEFGDGTNVTTDALSVQHTYATSGSFGLRATVTDQEGDSADFASEIVVPIGLAATVTPASVAGAAPYSTTFQVAPTGGVPPYTEWWNFGDGVGFNGTEVNFTFEAAGLYEVAAVVNDSGGRSVTLTIPVNVTARVAAVPLSANASYTAAPRTGTCGPVADVELLSGNAHGGTAPYSYAWNFGDGDTGTGSAVAHTYARPGDYPATLTATDANGTTAQALVAVHVVAPAAHACPPVAASLTGPAFFAAFAVGAAVVALAVTVVVLARRRRR